MPYFSWYGVELNGAIKKGKTFAITQEELDTYLFKRHIALLGCKTIAIRFWQQKVNSSDMTDIFRQLASLIDAQILLHDALHIIAMQHSKPAVQEMLYTITASVQEGNTLSFSLQKYPRGVNDIMIQLIESGHESGRLSEALTALALHLEGQRDFRNKIKSALLLPSITLLFFIVMVMTIFIVMVPYFAHIIRSINKPLPAATESMLAISDFLQANYFFMGGMFLAVVLMIWLLLQTKRSKKIIDATLLYVPCINAIIKEQYLVYCFQSLALLIKGGIPLVVGLQIIERATNNYILKKIMQTIVHQVASGSSLSYACSQHSWLFSQDIIAMIEVGQESGNLASIIQKISTKYREQLDRRLSTITRLLQPALMICLGLLVLLLIMGVYMPIFNLSYVI